MRTPSMVTRPLVALLVVGAFHATGSCATGITPPEITSMVQIVEGLTFTFGSETLCNHEEVSPNQEFSCTDESKNYPFVIPEVEVELQAFAIDEHEVTNFQYEHCVALGACTDPQGFNAFTLAQADYYLNPQFHDHPVVSVTWGQALEYCTFAGKTLPTEFQWERVAKGNPEEDYDRPYPIEGLSSVSGCKDHSPPVPVQYCSTNTEYQPVGDIDPGVNDFVVETGTGGENAVIYHLFGNAAEWTATGYEDDITCVGALPSGCTNCATCVTDDADLTCENECKSCDSCAQDGGSTDCFYGCEGETREFPVCTAYPSEQQPLPPATIAGTSNDKVIRGASVELGANRTCNFRSSYRDRRQGQDGADPAVGFRCARFLDVADGE